MLNLLQIKPSAIGIWFAYIQAKRVKVSQGRLAYEKGKSSSSAFGGDKFCIRSPGSGLPTATPTGCRAAGTGCGPHQPDSWGSLHAAWRLRRLGGHHIEHAAGPR